MQSAAETVEQYLAELDGIRRQAISAVRGVILDNLPDGYEEAMQFGMITYVVPLNVLADTYNGQPLMYIDLASQKRYMSLYLTVCTPISRSRNGSGSATLRQARGSTWASYACVSRNPTSCRWS